MKQQHFTVPEIAKSFEVPVHVADYAVRTRGIKPVGTLGLTRIFARWQLDAVRQAIAETGRRSPAPKRFTARFIDSRGTKAGGWTRDQLREWGIAWPPSSGWRKALIGQPIPRKSRSH